MIAEESGQQIESYSPRQSSVCVIVLNYQTYQATIDYVVNLQKQKNVILSILVVDNNSPNDSYEILARKFENAENVRVIKTSRNGGYAYGNNFGLRYLENVACEYVVISNNDVFLNDDLLLSRLIDKYQKLHAPALIAPKMRINGKVSSYSAWKLPTLFDEITASLRLLFHLGGDKKTYDLSLAGDSALPVDCLPGSFFLAKKEIYYSLGLMDEGTFLYMEEIILGFKVKKANLINYLIRDLFYDHYVAKTISAEVSFLGMTKHYVKSKSFFLRKYLKANVAQVVLVVFCLIAWRLSVFIRYFIKGAWRRGVSIFSGFCSKGLG